MKESYLFQLSEPLKISKAGTFVETATIELKAPTMDSFDEVSDFEQLFMGAVISASNMVRSKGEDLPEDEDAIAELRKRIPKANEIKMLLHISQEIKIKDIYRAFRKLACKDGLVDSGVPLKMKHFDMISRDDVIRMICEYSANFTFPSLLSEE